MTSRRTTAGRAAWAVSITLAIAQASASRVACAEGGLRKGPWLMDARQTEITVLAERESAGALTVTAVEERSGEPRDGGESPSEVTAESSGQTLLHELTLRGLRPGARYRYTVTGEGITPQGGRFATAPEGPGFVGFRFAIYGDTRSHRAPHRAVAQAVAREGADWAIHTGDLLDDGREESQWQDFFDIERELLASTIFVPVIGNHEIARPGSSGVDNYRRYVRCEPPGARPADESSAPSPELHYSFSWANVHVVLVNAYEDFTEEPAARWLDERLARARRAADAHDGWVLFVSHWGPRSSGPHGENRPFRMANVSETLRRHRVDLAISGHDHLYERGDDRGLRYIVSGGGGSPLYRRRFERDYARVIVTAHHYIRVDVERRRLLFTVLRPDGREIERCGLRREGWDCDTLGAPTRTPDSPSASAFASEDPFDDETASGAVGCSSRSRRPSKRAIFAGLLALTGLAALVYARRRRAREAAPGPKRPRRPRRPRH